MREPGRGWIAAALLLAGLAGLDAPLRAGEVVLGLGADDIARSASEAAGIEVRSDPVWRWSPGGWPVSRGLAAAAETDLDGDLWAALGPLFLIGLTPRWRIEASVMAGVYGRGSSGTELGTTAPIFRSSLGVNLALHPDWRLGGAISHKSNADTANDNAGTETLFLTIARLF